MEQRIARIEKQLEKIMDNELVHLKDDLAILHTNIEKIGVNVDWLMKFFWITATASVGSLATAVYGLILK